MYQMFERIMEDSFEGGSGSLEFSCSDIALILAPGALYEGTFTVYGNGKGETSGYVVSTDHRMECATNEFHGAEDIIGYRFHGEQLENGDVVKGEFHIVSNRGEYRLPYEVLMDRDPLSSSAGEIRNLSQFAGLAKENWEEALKLFYSVPFAKLLEELDEKREEGKEGGCGQKRLTELYRGFGENRSNPHNMEEFLIASGQKERVEYKVGTPGLVAENPVGVAEEAVTIEKNGWGYTRLQVETEGEFLLAGKKTLENEDFLGNRCRLPLYIDSSALHAGRNFGRVRISNPFWAAEVPVTVIRGGRPETAGNARRERKMLIVQLMELYQAHCFKKISEHTWLKEAGSIAERLVAMEEKDVMARLLQAQILISNERFQEGNWILEHSLDLMEQLEDDTAYYAYYLYLTTLLKPEAWYIKQVTEELESLYRRNLDCWQVAWVLLFLSPEYNRKPSAKWAFLERQFGKGCTSPLIYLEALQLLNQNPVMLGALKQFEIQVLSYGCKQDMLSAQLIDQMLYQAGRRKEFSPVLLRVLIACYGKKSTVPLLQEICSQLIKGGLTGPKVLRWYEQGLEQELRLTKLYEYYMMSIDLDSDREISRQALLYFSYQVNLDYEHSAYLYHYVTAHRQEDPEIYESYRERIEFFLIDQIRKEHINKDLAYLYKELLTPALFGEQVAKGLTKLLFSWSLKVEDARICRAVCCRPDTEEIMVYPVVNHSAWVSLYSPQDAVFLEDTNGNRYSASFCSRMEKLMEESQFLELTCFYALTGGAGGSLRLQALAGKGETCEFPAADFSMLLFAKYIWEQDLGERLTEEQLSCGRLLAEADAFSVPYRETVLLRLLREYASREDERSLELALDRIDPHNLDEAGRSEAVQYLVSYNRLEKAYQWVEEFGPGRMEAETLLQIVSRQAERVDYRNDAVLLQRAAGLFRQGKYDGNTMRYLSAHFRGLTGEMASVWKTAGPFGADLYEMSENLLLQILFTGSDVPEKMEIFQFYVSCGANEDVKEAFLRQCAYDYLMKGIPLDDFVIKELLQMYRQGEELRLPEKIAVLCYFGDGGEKTLAGRRKQEAEDFGGEGGKPLAKILEDLLGEMLGKEIYLNAFRTLPVDPGLLENMQDKAVVEYRTQKEERVLINYRIRQSESDPAAYKWEEMVPVCKGIYCRGFLLFFGESLQYYLEQEEDGVMKKVGEGVIDREDTSFGEAGSSYERINEILLANAVEDYNSLDRLLQDFYYREYLGDKLFPRR